MKNRDLRGLTMKEVLVPKIKDIIEKEGFDGSYSLNNTQAVILTNGEDYEIIVERNIYEELQKEGIVPKIGWL